MSVWKIKMRLTEAFVKGACRTKRWLNLPIGGYFCAKDKNANIFENHLNLVILVSIRKLSLGTLRWLTMCHGLSHSSAFLHQFVLAKLATSIIRVKGVCRQIPLSMLDGQPYSRLNVAVARLPVWMQGGMGSRVQSQARLVGIRFLYKLGQPPKTSLTYSLLSAAQWGRLLWGVPYSFHIIVHAICVVCIYKSTSSSMYEPAFEKGWRNFLIFIKTL